MSKTLFEIGQDMEALDNLLEELGGDVSDEVVFAAIDGWLNENAENLKEKADRYGALIQQRLAIAKARKEEAARIAALGAADERFGKALKARLKVFMEEHKMQKFETETFKFAIQANGGLRALNLLCEAKDLPERFVELVPQPRNDVLREEWEVAEAEVSDYLQEHPKSTKAEALEVLEPLVAKYSRLEERGTQLRIR